MSIVLDLIFSLKLSYDNRNSSLESISARCNEAVYSCASQYDVESEDVKMEGPFSKCIMRNENRMVWFRLRDLFLLFSDSNGEMLIPWYSDGCGWKHKGNVRVW